jgi:hypothetical protein
LVREDRRWSRERLRNYLGEEGTRENERLDFFVTV